MGLTGTSSRRPSPAAHRDEPALGRHRPRRPTSTTSCAAAEGDRALPLLGGVGRPPRPGPLARPLGADPGRLRAPRRARRTRRGDPPPRRPAGFAARAPVPAPARARAGCSTGSRIRAFNEFWFRKAPRPRAATSSSRSPVLPPPRHGRRLEPPLRAAGASSSGSACCPSARRTCSAAGRGADRARGRRRSSPCSRASAPPTPGRCRSRRRVGRSRSTSRPVRPDLGRPARPARPRRRRGRRPPVPRQGQPGPARAAPGDVPPARRVARRPRPARPRPPPQQRPRPAAEAPGLHGRGPFAG